MKRQEELEAALFVVAFFGLSILMLLFILKCDEILEYCRRKVCILIYHSFPPWCVILSNASRSVAVASEGAVLLPTVFIVTAI